MQITYVKFFESGHFRLWAVVQLVSLEVLMIMAAALLWPFIAYAEEQPSGHSPASGLAAAIREVAVAPSPARPIIPGEALTTALEKFIGVPFRVDGALNLAGQWVTFNQPETPLKGPGFNCSGFTVAAARELLGEDFPLNTVGADRQGDSGPGSPLGHDWDFGLDLILNLSQNHPRRFLPPQPVTDADQPPLFPLRPGRALGWGLDIQSPELEGLLRQLRPGHFAFFVFSKPSGHFPAGVSYYHVGIIIPDNSGIWLYHTTRQSRTYRLNLGDPAGMSRLRRSFPAIKGGERRVFMVEVIPSGAICPPMDRMTPGISTPTLSLSLK
ncbi:hypothetical protein C4J81_12540 [Deltaproteobacteria bacterium Smac51]|nr:hypothetical protein C4J81_12540 [Deltaproteobacteria bacterium Smac51]